MRCYVVAAMLHGPDAADPPPAQLSGSPGYSQHGNVTCHAQPVVAIRMLWMHTSTVLDLMLVLALTLIPEGSIQKQDAKHALLCRAW